MSGRNVSKDQANFDKGLQRMVVVVSIPSPNTGAPVLQQWNPSTRSYSAAGAGGFRGCKSITRTAAGLWTIALQQLTQRVVGGQAVSMLAGGLAAAPNMSINLTGTNVNSQSAPAVAVAFLSSASTAADPAAGELIAITLDFQDSTAS